MAQLTEISQEKSVSLAKAILVIVAVVLVVALLGTVIGKMFVWKNFNKVSKEEYILKSAQEAIKADLMNPNKLVDLGWAQSLNKDYEGAISSYKQALKYDDNNFNAYLNLDIIYMNRKQFDQAEANLKKAIEIFPKSDLAHLNLGILYIQSKNYSAGKNELDIAYSFKPGSSEVMYYMGQVEEKMGQKEEALKFYRKAFTLNPKDQKVKEAIDHVLGMK